MRENVLNRVFFTELGLDAEQIRRWATIALFAGPLATTEIAAAPAEQISQTVKSVVWELTGTERSDTVNTEFATHPELAQPRLAACVEATKDAPAWPELNLWTVAR